MRLLRPSLSGHAVDKQSGIIAVQLERGILLVWCKLSPCSILPCIVKSYEVFLRLHASVDILVSQDGFVRFTPETVDLSQQLDRFEAFHIS